MRVLFLFCFQLYLWFLAQCLAHGKQLTKETMNDRRSHCTNTQDLWLLIGVRDSRVRLCQVECPDVFTGQELLAGAMAPEILTPLAQVPVGQGLTPSARDPSHRPHELTPFPLMAPTCLRKHLRLAPPGCEVLAEASG